MKRLLFYLLSTLAFVSRGFLYSLYMKLIVMAHRSQGVKFIGQPEYIHQDAYLDPSGGLTIGEKTVISTRVIILTHDWSFLTRYKAKGVELTNIDNSLAFKSVNIGNSSFIGAGAIVLPGSQIGTSCIIGAGAVIKGKIDDFSIMAGNPAKRIGDTRQINV